MHHSTGGAGTPSQTPLGRPSPRRDRSGRGAILQGVGCRQGCSRERHPGHHRRATREIRSPPPGLAPHEARQFQRVSEHVQTSSADPDEEAGLMQSDEGATRMAKREERDAGSEEGDRREDEHRAYK